METVGQSLKAARELKQMSASDVADSTQIQEQTILAIERDDYDSIPAPLYVRGFIKLYAECVGLDPAPLIRAYNNRNMPELQYGKKSGIKMKKNGRPAFSFERLHGFFSGFSRIIKERFAHSRSAQPARSFSLRVFFRRLRDILAKLGTNILSAIRLLRPHIGGIRTSTKSIADMFVRKISRLPIPRFRLSSETRRIIPIVALAVVLLVFTVWGWSCHSIRTRPRTFDPRLVRDPPEPYLD